jgi:hypothetical protein
MQVKLFNEDPGTEAMIVIGEIGGSAEEEAAAWIKDNCRNRSPLLSPARLRRPDAEWVTLVRLFREAKVLRPEKSRRSRRRNCSRRDSGDNGRYANCADQGAKLMAVVAKGLEGIIANTTALSDVIGDKGQLVYRGYDINELVGKVDYKEVVFLLWKGHLPNRTELDDFMRKLRAERQLPGPVIDFIKTAPEDANPMDVMRNCDLDAWALRFGYRQGGDARDQRAPRPQHHGEDWSDRSLFSSRAPGKIAAASAR